ncbi:MAG: hypothetical protein M3P27_08470 [Acidobacteriota bacterium]|nr:hypothetical protein [Acidobacteriota bacterium]
MKKFMVLTVAIAVLSWAAMAQTSASGQASSQTQGSTSTGASTSVSRSGASANASADKSGANAGLANGTAINATLSKSIDSRKAKSGDAVEAKTTSDVKSAGKTVIPRGSKLIGHVTQASARGKGDADSTLGIVFDHAVLKNGQQVPLNATIRALAAARSVAASNDDMIGASGGPGSAGGSTVGGVGATGGGVLGGVGNTAGNTVGSTAGSVGNTVASTTRAAGSATRAGTSATGELTSTTQGVIGMPGVTLSQATNATMGVTQGVTQGATISSIGKNVKLDSGTQMVLSVAGTASNQ